MSETAFAQLPLRGHYMRRDGLFHVERARWGGGITPQGAAVLMHGIDVFGPIVGGIVGREAAADRGAETRATTRAALPQEYIVEQRRANDLLERTAALVGYKATTGVGPQVVGPSVIDPDRGTPASEAEFGPNPWKQRPE